MNFTLYYAGDAYSTANKIMGRQSAGKAFMRGVARSHVAGPLHAMGPDRRSASALVAQLQGDGYRGNVQWSDLPGFETASATGVLYYPAPPWKELAAVRNTVNPAAFSLMGVTHTLSSEGAMDQISNLVLPPFKPWDCLICTSRAALTFAENLQAETRDYWRRTTGASQFAAVQMPVIPLGIDAPAFAGARKGRDAARQALGIDPSHTVFLFSGRLSFHAKANPAVMYQALEAVARKGHKVVLIEAGVFTNDAIRASFAAAQAALAPSVRCIGVDGKQESLYQQAWQAADVFISLSDNIQETFGLTPLEAMAAGLPVIVSDWDGYKDTVRDGIDGFRIPTYMPASGSGHEPAMSHALGVDTYDMYIGRISMETVIDVSALTQAIERLATDAALRQAMGEAGQKRAVGEYDWPVILQRYDALAGELNAIRQHAVRTEAACVQPEAWPQRADPLHRFAHFPTHTVTGDWQVQRVEPAANAVTLPQLLELAMANYVLHPQLLPREAIERVYATVAQHCSGSTPESVGTLIARSGLPEAVAMRALMWLAKMGLVCVNVCSR